jgi:hypothetical protein
LCAIDKTNLILIPTGVIIAFGEAWQKFGKVQENYGKRNLI